MFLIYPYWNVKIQDSILDEGQPGVSNLSILECKIKNNMNIKIVYISF